MPMTQGKKRRRELGVTQGKKRRWMIKFGAAAGEGARLTLVRPGKKKNKKASSEPNKAAAADGPVYLVVEHAVKEPTQSFLDMMDTPPRSPTHSVLEVARGAAPRRLLEGRRWMSFAAVGTGDGPRIVGVGMDRTVVYNPKTCTESRAPRLVYPKMHPVLIPHGCKLYALSCSPLVVPDLDFMPWFFVIDLGDIKNSRWRELPPPPIFPCRINPLEYRDRPEIRVAAYAVVGSHILLSVQRDKGTGTCAFDMDAEAAWEMVDDKNLPFIGQAVPLGGHRFVACSKAKDGAAAVYHMEMEVDLASTTDTTKMKLSIFEVPVESKGIVPGQHLCAMGDDSFSSFDIRYADPGPEAMLEKVRIVHRTYSQVRGRDAETNSVGIVKQERRIYKLRDRFGHLAHPSPVVAAFTM